MIVTYHNVTLVEKFIANAGRSEVQRCFRQMFAELNLKIHKDDVTSLVHFIGGKAAPLLCLLTQYPNYGYRITFSSSGQPNTTAVQISIIIGYGSRWGSDSPEEKARKPITAFMNKFRQVIAEHEINLVKAA